MRARHKTNLKYFVPMLKLYVPMLHVFKLVTKVQNYSFNAQQQNGFLIRVQKGYFGFEKL